MIQIIIEFLNHRLNQLGYFGNLSGLTEQVKKTMDDLDEDDEETEIESTYPVEYKKDGTYNHIDNLVGYNVGLGYHREIASSTQEEGETESAIACDAQIKRTYSLRFVFYVSKDILGVGNDSQGIDDKITNNIQNILNVVNDKNLRELLGLDFVSISPISTIKDRYELFDEEFENVRFNLPFEYVFACVDYQIELEGLESCFKNFGCDSISIEDLCPDFSPVTITDENNPDSPIEKGSGEAYECTPSPFMVADFSASETEVFIGEEVVFTDLTTGNPTYWSWMDNDGAFSILQNPTKVFDTSGQKTITLLAGNDSELGDVVIKENYITVNEPLKILDSIAGAGRAYSFSSKLRNLYAGSAFRIRDKNSSAELDIGFDSGVVDHAAVDTFLGVNAGSIPVLYDQSGNASSLSQTTSSIQPDYDKANDNVDAKLTHFLSGMFPTLAGDFTYFFWIKSSFVNTDYRYAFLQGDGASTDLITLSFNNPAGVKDYFLIYNSGGGTALSGATENYLNAAWRPVHIRREGATLSLFIDGILIDSSIASTLYTIGDEMYLFRNSILAGTARYFEGAIDDLILWDQRALSLAEIAESIILTQSSHL